MNVLVTGSTGFIGAAIGRQLARIGHDVNGLYRNDKFLLELERSKIHPVKGDITKPEEVKTAMLDCEYCFHLAAIAKPWAKQNSIFETVNVDGTRNVLEAALNANIKRVVFTSTASVFGPAPADAPVTESSSPKAPVDSEYERSKQRCELLVHEFRERGLDIVAVYPSRVYGPGCLSDSNALTTIFKKFDSRRWRVIPGNGSSVGNYVFIDDVVEAHSKAMFESKPNESYLVGGENLSFNQIVDALRLETGNNQRLFHVPGWLLMLVANLQVAKAKVTGSPPTITPAFAKKYLRDWHLDHSKIFRDLDVSPTRFVDGLKQTLEWIRTGK